MEASYSRGTQRKGERQRLELSWPGLHVRFLRDQVTSVPIIHSKPRTVREVWDGEFLGVSILQEHTWTA